MAPQEPKPTGSQVRDRCRGLSASTQPGDGESGPRVPGAGQSMRIPGPPRPQRREEERDQGPVFQKPAGPTLRGRQRRGSDALTCRLFASSRGSALASLSATGLQTWAVTLGDRGGTPGPKRETQRAQRHRQTGRRRVHAPSTWFQKRRGKKRTERTQNSPCLRGAPRLPPGHHSRLSAGQQRGIPGSKYRHPRYGSRFYPFPGGMEDRAPCRLPVPHASLCCPALDRTGRRLSVW